MDNEERRSAGAPEDNQNATKHGAFSYLRRTQDGELVPVSLAMVESQVIEDLERDGPIERIRKQATRLATASELLWAYMNKGSTEFLRAWKHWGWATNAEIRAWREYLKARGDDRGGDLMDVALRAIDGEAESDAED